VSGREEKVQADGGATKKARIKKPFEWEVMFMEEGGPEAAHSVSKTRANGRHLRQRRGVVGGSENSAQVGGVRKTEGKGGHQNLKEEDSGKGF